MTSQAAHRAPGPTQLPAGARNRLLHLVVALSPGATLVDVTLLVSLVAVIVITAAGAAAGYGAAGLFAGAALMGTALTIAIGYSWLHARRHPQP